jgi:hypothetical protein
LSCCVRVPGWSVHRNLPATTPHLAVRARSRLAAIRPLSSADLRYAWEGGGVRAAGSSMACKSQGSNPLSSTPGQRPSPPSTPPNRPPRAANRQQSACASQWCHAHPDLLGGASVAGEDAVLIDLASQVVRRRLARCVERWMAVAPDSDRVVPHMGDTRQEWSVRCHSQPSRGTSVQRRSPSSFMCLQRQ